MIERVCFERSKITGQYEIVKTERLSQEEEAQRLYDARQKALWDKNSRTRTAQNKAVREVGKKLIDSGYLDEQICELTNLSLSEIEKLKAKFNTQSLPSAT